MAPPSSSTFRHPERDPDEVPLPETEDAWSEDGEDEAAFAASLKRPGGSREAEEASQWVPLMTWRKQLREIPDELVERFVREIGGAIQSRLKRDRTDFQVTPMAVQVQTDRHGTAYFRLRDLRSVTRGERDPKRGIEAYYGAPEDLLGDLGGPDAAVPVSKAAWWSLGRTLQTFLLNAHVLSRILMRTIDDTAEEHADDAMKLLREKLPGLMNAGAVESMGTLTPRVERILKGLLTRRVSARWNWVPVERWCKGEAPPEYYRMPRSKPLFPWEGRAYTIQDAAIELTRDRAEWERGIDQVLELEDGSTLGGFVTGPKGDASLGRKLHGLRQFSASSTFSHYPPELVREVIGAVGLMVLSGQEFRWRGEPVSAEFIARCVEPGTEVDNFVALELIAHPKIVQQIHLIDGETTNRLSKVARTADEIRSILTDRHGIKFDEPAERARLWRSALCSKEEFQEKQSKHRKAYARCKSTHLDDLLKRDGLSLAELVVLDFTVQEPRKFGYVSFLQDAEQERAELEAEGRKLRDTLFWVRLERAVHAGLPILARGPDWVTLLTLFALTGFAAKPGPLWAAITLAPIVCLGIARQLLQKSIARSVERQFPHARRWRWQDGARRCRREARALTGERHASRVVNRILQVNEGLAKLTLLNPLPTPFTFPPHPYKVWAAAIVSWAVVGSMGGFFCREMFLSPPSWEKIRAAWAIDLGESGDAAPQALAQGRGDSSTASGGSGQSQPLEAKVSDKLLLVSDMDYAIDRGLEWAARTRWEPGDAPIAIRLQGLVEPRVVLFNPSTLSLTKPVVYVFEEEPSPGQTIAIEGSQLSYYGR